MRYYWWDADSTGQQSVSNVCKNIKDANAHLVLYNNAPLTSGVTFTSGGSSVESTYYSYGGDHYLFVVDKSPSSTGSYPKSFTVECEVSSSEYADFELVTEGFSGSTISGAAKEAPSSIKWTDSIDSAGEGKFYHIVSIA